MSPAIPRSVSSGSHNLLGFFPPISTPSRPSRRTRQNATNSKLQGSPDVAAAAKRILSKPAEIIIDINPWRTHLPDLIKPRSPTPLTPATAGARRTLTLSRRTRLRDKRSALAGNQSPSSPGGKCPRYKTPSASELSSRLFDTEERTPSLRSFSLSPSPSPCGAFLSPMKPLSPLVLSDLPPSQSSGDPFSRSASLFLTSPSYGSSASVDSIFLSSSSDINSIQYKSGNKEVSLFTESPLSHFLRDIKDSQGELLPAVLASKPMPLSRLVPLPVKHVLNGTVKIEDASEVQFCCATVQSSRVTRTPELPSRRPAMRAKHGDITSAASGHLLPSPQSLRSKRTRIRNENDVPGRVSPTTKAQEKMDRTDKHFAPVERDLNVHLRRAVSSGASSTRPRVSSALSRPSYTAPRKEESPIPATKSKAPSQPRPSPRPTPHKIASETQALPRFAIDDERHTIHRPALHQKLSLMARLQRKTRGEMSVSDLSSPNAMYNMPLARVSTSNLLTASVGELGMPRLQSLRNMFKV
ncbi:hypothetical protein EVG20_g1983 [Dentipellis fragilis]|uniref:Uncharacterized protein n=1 Tax=Dentipellis fragilis TaxID=205917 RepID=A0A4Y9ZB04_9AGAM|nr:hypothetical protein EVG20_g1983 [Dentipellis fragilis]